MSLLTQGVLGALFHYGITTHLTSLGEERDPQTHIDILVTGFAGGVIGGVGLAYWAPSPTWTQMGLAAIVGVVLFDYFLFDV
jgi:hypothetical protein